MALTTKTFLGSRGQHAPLTLYKGLPSLFCPSLSSQTLAPLSFPTHHTNMPRVTSAPSSSAYRRLQQQQQQQLEASSSSSSRKYGKAAALKDAAVMSDNTESENESDAGDYAFLYDLDEPMDYHFQVRVSGRY